MLINFFTFHNRFFNFVLLCTWFFKLKTTHMGKGDKKSKRGKIVIGTYGVRRRRKKAGKAAVKLSEEKKARTASLRKEREVKESRVAKEKSPVKEKPSRAREEKQTEEKVQKEQKQKKEKKSD